MPRKSAGRFGARCIFICVLAVVAALGPTAFAQTDCPDPQRISLAEGSTVGELQLWHGFNFFCRVPTRVEITRDGQSVASAGNWTFDKNMPNDPGTDRLWFEPKPVQNGGYEITLFYDDAPGVEPTKVGFIHRDYIATRTPYGDFRGGTDVAVGDVDGDGRGELVTAAGPGGGPHVIVWKVGGEPVDANGAPDLNRGYGTSVMASFMAYDPAFRGGVNVAVGDVNGDGRGEVITGPGAGGGPHVRVFAIAADGTATAVDGLMAYTEGFRGGVDVAAGNLSGTRADEVVVGAGPGGGPHVRVVQRAPGGFAAGGGDVASFMAYGESFRGGVYVSTYVTDPERPFTNDVVTGARAGGGPHVRTFPISSPDGATVPRSPTVSFYAYDQAFTGGVDVAGANIFKNAHPGGDGPLAILTGAGPGGGPHAKVWTGAGEIGGWFAGQTSDGLRVAAGDLTGDGRADLVTAHASGLSEVTVRPY